MSGHRRPTAAGVRSARIRTWLSDLIHDFIADDREPVAEVEWDKPPPKTAFTVDKDGKGVPVWTGGKP